MGLLSYIGQAVTDANAKAIRESWGKMRRLNPERLIDVCNNSGNSTTKALACILISQHSNLMRENIDGIENILDKVKRLRKQDYVTMGGELEWREIREYIDRMADSGYLPRKLTTASRFKDKLKLSWTACPR